MDRVNSADVPAAPKRIDLAFVAGLMIAAATVIVGLCSTGVGLSYFLQPTGAVIVLGGTVGVLFLATPGRALLHSWRRAGELLSARSVNQELLIEEIVSYARLARHHGMLAIEPASRTASIAFLRDALLLALDVKDRAELEAALGIELRMKERQGEADAKALEVAGGFAPTLGIIGTVVGLIEVLRHFTSLEAVGAGIGTAFVSTIYGLVLANLVLLPIAYRIRARTAEQFENEELILEGVLCLVDKIHPSLIRSRLTAFLRSPGQETAAVRLARQEAVPEL